MMLLHYKTKKDLKQNVGKELNYSETSLFGPEYKNNGSFVGCDIKRKFFAKITIQDNLIKKVCWKKKLLNGIPEARPRASEALEKKLKRIEKGIRLQAFKRVGPPIKNQGPSARVDNLQAIGYYRTYVKERN